MPKSGFLLFRVFFALLLVALLASSSSPVDDTASVQVTLDESEAEQVLSIIARQKAGQEISPADWQQIFSTEPYRRLKQREQGFHHEFSEEAFQKFVLSPALAAESVRLRQTLDNWKRQDLRTAAVAMLVWLPANAVIKTKVFPIIKPAHNSFVFEPSTDSAIFLYLDTEESPELFRNTVAHEMHHIGLASTDHQYEERIAALNPRARKAAGWMEAFGEGLAVLAAAGGPDHDPVEFEKQKVRDDWKHGMRNLDSGFAALNAFFEQVLDGRLEGDVADEKAYTFFGDIRGPWYFVGYRMAMVVEQRFGRKALVECMLDYRFLLSRYNAAAIEQKQSAVAKLPRWSSKVIEGVRAPAPR